MIRTYFLREQPKIFFTNKKETVVINTRIHINI